MSDAPLTIVPEGARIGDAVVRLTRAERALLAWLVAHAGEPQPADRLMREVWGYRANTTSRTVVSTIHRLRAKLEPAGAAGWIRTVPGEGYVLDRLEVGVGPVSDVGLVGREAEIATVRGWLGGRGRTLLVTGAPGVGKSAVVAAALDKASGAWRIDLAAATLAAALEALDTSPTGAVLWLDDADPVLAGPGARLGDRHRRVVTCRYAVDLPGATRLHIEPLDERSTRALLDRLLARRFPAADPAPAERARRVAASQGNPARLLRIAWSAEGAGAPPGCDRHRTEAETLAWGLAGLPADLTSALRRMCAVPCPLDDDSAGVLVGRDEVRPVLAALRDRGLLDEDDGCWSVPAALRDAVDADPAGIEPLRRKVVADAPAAATRPHQLRTAPQVRWGLMSWADTVTDDPDELYLLIQGLDHHAVWHPGRRFDSRPLLARAVERLPADDQWWLARRQAMAEIRHGVAPEGPRVQQLLQTAVALADAHDASAALLARRSWVGALLAGGAFARAVAVAREMGALARAARDRSYESSACILQAVAWLRMGRLDDAREAARLAGALDPEPHLSWQHARSFGMVLADTGRAAEATALLRSAADELRRVGRTAYAPVLDAEATWTAWAVGEVELDAARAALQDAWEALDGDATVPALALAVIELTAGRVEVAARWLQRGPTERESAADVRAVGAAIHASLRVPVRWDELPAAPAEADERLAQLAEAFAHVAVGRLAEASAAQDAVAAHPTRLVRALGPILGRLAREAAGR
jgi:hypothetical protein